MKRARADSLTGGTKDVNPQIYSFTIAQTVADTAQQQAFPVPIPRYPGSSSRAVVMEIIRVQFTIDDLVNVAGTQFVVCTLSSSAVPTAGAFAALTDTRVIAHQNLDFLFATAAGFQYTDARVKIFDCTDDAGHGILVGTDNIFLTLFSGATGRINTVNCKVTYRMKEIGLAEYIGIVQAAQ